MNQHDVMNEENLLNENLHVKTLRIYDLDLSNDDVSWNGSSGFGQHRLNLSMSIKESQLGELALGAFETWKVKCFKGILSS